MKSVLISIQPKWVEKIAKGEKTIEVRKTKPNLATPFKCYIYCTKDNKTAFNNHNGNMFLSPKGWQDYSECNGKVIGEFVCDKIDISVVELKPNDIEPCYWKLINGSCLTKNELMNYGKYNALYGWHISKLKIYDKPKELSEFKTVCYEQHCKLFYDRDCDKDTCSFRTIKRPPQSWCYVEVQNERN